MPHKPPMMNIHDDNPEHHGPAVYYQAAEAPKWIGTILTSLGATLVGALLLWIASSQMTVSREIAVLAATMQNMNQQIAAERENRVKELEFVTGRFDRIWPRIRANATNIAVLKRKLESMCNCEVEMQAPEEF